MGKLEKLSPAQEEKMKEVKNFWTNYIFSCKNQINRDSAKINIDWLYRLSNKKEPIIIYVDSPMGCQYAVAYLKAFLKGKPMAQVGAQVRAQVWDQVGAQVRAQVWAQVGDQVGDQVRAQVRDQVGDQVGAQVRAQVRDQVGDQVWAQVWAQVGAQVRDQVWAQVWDQVRAQVWDQKLSYESFSNYGSITDYGWVSFYDFFTQIGVINHEKYNQFKSLLTSGIYDMIQLEGFCIVSDLPKKINRNESNRLHSENGSAIEFKDGYKQWYWNGVSVSQKLIEFPESITKEDIVNEKNAEKRRCIREVIGTKKYAELLELTELDKDYVNGQDVILYKTKKKDDLINEHIYFVKVICHSTLREYFLCVPPEAATNAWAAVAWTFGKKKEEYAPLIET